VSDDDLRDLLIRAEDALHSFAMRALGVSPRLEVPYTDAPELSPWTHTIGPQARRAHDLAMEIRKRLGLPHRMATRALGTPPLMLEEVLAEYERLRSEPPDPHHEHGEREQQGAGRRGQHEEDPS
jgi:hypothetical protein